MSKRPYSVPMYSLAIGLMLAAVALSGCKGDATAPAEPPIAAASVEVLNLHTTGAYPEYDGACQTNGLVEFRAYEGDVFSGSPSGEPVVLEWSFMVDRGLGLEPSPDLGNGTHIWVESNTGKPMSERVVKLNLFTIGFHQVTLTVRTRDGQSTSTTLEVLVTSCEDCG